jgi:hypothetical protein
MEIGLNLNQNQKTPAFKAHIVNLNKIPESLRPQVITEISEQIGKGVNIKLKNLKNSDVFVGFNKDNKILIATGDKGNNNIIKLQLIKILKTLGLENFKELITHDGEDIIKKAKSIVRVITEHHNGAHTEYQYGKIQDDVVHWRSKYFQAKYL